jgi:hypothetical protein
MSATVIEILNPRAKTIRQKNEAFHVKALRKHSYFEQIVKRILAGEPVQSIARWCEEVSRKTGVQNFTFFTWRLYISTLKNRIKVTLKTSEIERPIPTPELVQDVVDQIRRDNDIPVGEEKPDLKPHMASIWSSVKKAIRKVDSEMILKVAFFAQAERLEKLLKKEDAEGQLDKEGYKEILALKDIGDALRKFEVGEQMLRGGKSHAYGGEYTSLAANVATTTPPVSPTDSNNNSLLARVSRLDVIDRNLLVTAAERVINMIELQVQIDKAEAGGLETNTASEDSAELGDDFGASRPDESASPANN